MQAERSKPPNLAARWSVPPDGWVTLNSDGSFDDGAVGAGMILRNDKGAIIFSACRGLFSCREALEAEGRRDSLFQFKGVNCLL